MIAVRSHDRERGWRAGGDRGPQHARGRGRGHEHVLELELDAVDQKRIIALHDAHIVVARDQAINQTIYLSIRPAAPARGLCWIKMVDDMRECRCRWCWWCRCVGVPQAPPRQHQSRNTRLANKQVDDRVIEGEEHDRGPVARSASHIHTHERMRESERGTRRRSEWERSIRAIRSYSLARSLVCACARTLVVSVVCGGEVYWYHRYIQRVWVCTGSEVVRWSICD